MTPEKVGIDAATTALIGIEIVPVNISTWIHFFKDTFSSVKLCASNTHLFKKLKLYNSLKNTFELGVRSKLAMSPMVN